MKAHGPRGRASSNHRKRSPGGTLPKTILSGIFFVVGCSGPSATATLTIDPGEPMANYPYAVTVSVETSSSGNLCAILTCNTGSFGGVKTAAVVIAEGENGTRTAVAIYQSPPSGGDVIIANVMESAACPPAAGATAVELTNAHRIFSMPDAGASDAGLSPASSDAGAADAAGLDATLNDDTSDGTPADGEPFNASEAG